MKENKRINNLDKNNTRFSIRKYQGYGATSVAIIGFIIISCFNEAKADSDKYEIRSHQQSMTNHLTTLPSDNQKNTSNNEFNNRNQDISQLSLNKSIQMDELKKLIKQYKAINLNDKTEESIKLFQADLVQAESLMNNPQSQQHVDEFYHKFLNSAGKLRKKETASIKHERSESNTYRLGDEVRSQTFSHIRHKRNAVSFRSADQSNLSTDPLKANETNPEIQNGNFSQVSGGPLPTSSKRLTVVTNVDNWHSYSTDPNPEYPMFYTTTAVNYPNFMSNGNAPYGVILGRTTDGWNRNVIDSKVAGIYQDIDVVPGSELNVNFISTSPVFSDGAAGAKLKISNVEQNRVLFDSRLNGMGPYPTGKLSAMINIPNDINRVRISFLPVSSTGRVSVQRSSREHGFGDNSSYYHGGSVSDVRINSGSYVISKVTQREYTTRPNSSNDTFARATINLSVENKGHNQSKDTYYEVILPQNSRLISTRGGSGNYNNATNKLSIRLDNLNPGDRRDISYTVDFESLSPKLINLNAHVLYKTNATFRGNDGQRTGDNIVDLQSIALLMNKDVLETELNEIDKFIRDLNEADFTIDSWSALQEKMTEGRNILNEQQNQVALEDQASQETINNVTQSLEILKNNLKYKTPSQPVIKSNNQIPNITISSAEKADKLTITYQNTDNESASIIANKLNNQWSLNNNIPGIEIDMQTGLVTIDYKAVYPESVVGANDKTGNSDASAESRITMPRKEATPHSPIVEANEEHVNVTIAPNGEATQIAIKYRTLDGQEATLVASKTNQQWTLNKQIDHVNVDENTGKVTMGYQAVQPESEIIATETKGNSDASTENRVTMPRKEVTPLSPIVEANEEHVNVVIAPNGEATQITVKYRTPDGQEATFIASKTNQQWTLNKQIDHVNVDENSGKVTMGYQAVQPESEIIATETKGNSDASAENRVTMPRKEATPIPPTLEASVQEASVTVTPNENATKVFIKYLDINDEISTIIASKNESSWTLNKDNFGIKIDPLTGKVIISYVAVQPESDVIATESQGNSDLSEESRIIMPTKEEIPEPPILEADSIEAKVNIFPNDEATRVVIMYTSLDGQESTLVASKTNQQWTLNKQIDYVNVDENSGKVTMGYQAVQPESEIIATETKGNSDASAESRVTMPRKEATPLSPIVEANEERVNVTIVPNGEATQIAIKYRTPDGQEATFIASKNESSWTLNKQIDHVNVDENSGKVTIDYQAVQPESEIIATETNGNSNASAESRITMPVKEKTPAPPISIVNESNASVEIIPQVKVTRLSLQYIDAKGQQQNLIATLNQNQWTLNKNVSHITLDNNTGKILINYQAVYPESEVIARESKGNSDSSNVSMVTMPRKEVTPLSPIVEANEEHVNVVIAPNGEATQITVKYRTPDGQEATFIASKNESSWTLNKQIDHVNVDENSGNVTIDYQAVQPESEVIATETKGNSDASAENRVTMPRKKVTPLSPIVEANEERVNVTIAPNGEATQIAVKYRTPDGQESTLVASKTNQQWTLNKQIDHVNVDENSGKVTMGYQAVQPESEVIATETKGNSDASAESRVIMPRKTATPKPPIIKVDEMNASLAIIPYKNTTAINIHYIDKKGIKSMVTAIKNNDQWQLDEKIKYVKIDKKTGTVIINYQIVQENSEIIATAINGNSDKSEEVKVLMPIKEVTPLAPLLETNYKKATVSILPQSNATKLDFKYRDKKGDSKVLIVKRFKNIWKANEQISGVTINPEFGQVVINYQVVYPESDILAAQYVGNSDASEWAKVKMPKKELAPHSPSLTYDNRNNKILIEPNSNATEMELSYVDKNNRSLKVKALKINNRWKFDSSVSNISIDPNTGKIVLQPQFLLTNSKIIVFAKKGNSDASISVSLRVPVVKKIELEPISNVPVPVSLNKKRIQFDDCSGVNYSLNKQLSKTQLPDTGYSEKTSKSNILSVLLLGLGLLSYSRKRKEKQ
ncbi:SasC/FmtB family protein [Staphylococcus epidermidis]|uniref:SasC/FmtB family protein n=3 Tax=Staphylococcus epidermidis TaxID=1282 RepID=UPI001FEFFEB9|nr:SasC/FmtB family protein [Staphylococcus epidermidis]MCG1301606.1 LPXTG cell wall anchor domain-containing protein [Staphylococcus epidermidis]MCG1439129.1 LPXTG cell wall anchor domain-containing protein [Staphylococcus epidermidis]MCG1752810.1 LPXTG cell wall anchor domain-containing protein [Staphylococcus epidermidis]MCG1837691.1 LPXTG cell wall anchor domain-containing protein [Staphylococcus epidermidis]MCG1846642.1 LPXTG cell wall anchor domain-containing protein [Staphylococcus epid